MAGREEDATTETEERRHETDEKWLFTWLCRGRHHPARARGGRKEELPRVHPEKTSLIFCSVVQRRLLAVLLPSEKSPLFAFVRHLEHWYILYTLKRLSGLFLKVIAKWQRGLLHRVFYHSWNCCSPERLFPCDFLRMRCDAFVCCRKKFQTIERCSPPCSHFLFLLFFFAVSTCSGSVKQRVEL